MMSDKINALFQKFETLTALVIGDVMIDAYYWGKVDRISPEAPVPVVHVQERENRLGGAANVALNIKSLGAKAIICSVIGKDSNAEILKKSLLQNEFGTDGIVESSERTTTVKTRIISQGQHLLRVDEESTEALHTEDEKNLLQAISTILESNKIDVIIFEDYNKGVLTTNVITTVIDWAIEKKIPTTVDPKKDNFFAYKKCTLFKPNLKELREGLKLDFGNSNFEALKKAIKNLEEKLGNKITMVTLSELGVMIKEGDSYYHQAAHERSILDVSGAGDTVISVASLALAVGANHELIAALSNLAGGLVCEEVGVVPINSTRFLCDALLSIT